MEAEARPLLDLLELQRDQPHPLIGPAPAQVYSGAAFGLNLHVVCNGEVLDLCRCCLLLLLQLQDDSSLMSTKLLHIERRQ